MRRIATWARRARARLRECGLRVQARVTEDRIVFARAGADIDEASARLVLGVNAQGISVSLEVPTEGLRAARARLADPARALELTAALEALPEQFTLSLGDGPSLAASVASAEDVRALLDRAEPPRRALSVGWSVSRDVALEHAAVLDDQLEDAIVALGTAYALLADSGSAGPLVLRTARGREPRRAGADDDRHVAAFGEGGKRRARAHPRERLEREHDRDGEGSSSARPRADADPESAREREAALKAPRALGHKTLRLGGRRRPLADARAPDGKSDGTIDKGARVRVLEGPFAGKVGVVHELDGKGGARVMLGLLAVRLAVKDLAVSVERRNRPLLSSSHRKPVPARS